MICARVFDSFQSACGKPFSNLPIFTNNSKMLFCGQLLSRKCNWLTVFQRFDISVRTTLHIFTGKQHLPSGWVQGFDPSGML
jgi:hypothetical protein